jgi:large subunit ribosomal protein L15
MDLSNLKPAEGATKQRKRIGRGQGSGRGGTSTRGHKGAKSRSGYSRKVGFEGGQMPLQKRVPKFGFTNPNRKEFKGVNLDTLQFIADTKKVTEITKEVLLANGIISKNDLVKILGRGELTVKLNVTVEQYSASAKEAIEKNGGTANVLSTIKVAKTSNEESK